MEYERLTYKDKDLNDYIPIDRAETEDDFFDRFYKFCDRLGELEDKIENEELVEQKQGKWLPMWDDCSRIICSKCGCVHKELIEYKNYCGNCGAIMR